MHFVFSRPFRESKHPSVIPLVSGGFERLIDDQVALANHLVGRPVPEGSRVSTLRPAKGKAQTL